MKKAKRIFQTFLDCFFPMTCAACRTPLRVGRQLPLCKDCMLLWEAEKALPCPSCQKEHFSCRCLPQTLESSVDAYCHLLPYDANTQIGKRVVLEGKERMHPRLAAFLAQELCDQLPALPPHTVIAYVPRRAKAKRKAGYDQAERIAKVLGELCQKTVLRAIASEEAGTKAQKELNRQGRMEKASAAYRAGKEIDAVKGAFVLLIDDVLTSGATIANCGTILKENGADAVCALTIAYTNLKPKDRKDV